MKKEEHIVKVEVFSDFICPWCYLGKARLNRLQKQLTQIPFSIHLRPYLLYPSIPEDGVEKSVFAKKSKPGMGRSLRAESKNEQIEIKYNLIDRIPTSRAAHRLMELLPHGDLKLKLADGIFKAYFSDGVDIGSADRLTEIATSLGVQDEILYKFLNSDEGEKAFEQGILDAKESFISLVPTIRLNDQFLVPGLQGIDIWEKYIARAYKLQKQE